MYSRSIANLIEALKKLPSVGERTAERYVFHWLKNGKKEVNELRDALDSLLKNIKSCSICWNFSDSIPCPICANPARDHGTICVIADPQDIPVIEKTGNYHGVYHVLRGAIDPNDEDSWNKTKIKELFKRIKSSKEINEVILALNLDWTGETTALYIESKIKSLAPTIKVSRLARGLPLGSSLQYADEITLGSAFKNRR